MVRGAGGRRPVLVGAAAVQQAIDEPGGGDDAVGLMTRALRAAAGDCGAPAILGRIERIAVPKGMWSYRDPARLVAARVGATAARTVLVELGIPQQSLVNDGLRRILDGDLEVVAVVGGEARRRESVARRAGVETTAAAEPDGAAPDELLVPAAELVAKAELDVGLVVPAQQYAMIEQALRVADGLTIAEHRERLGRLWAGFSEVAAVNPAAAFPTVRDAAWLSTPSPANKLQAFPYLSWHCSQWTVDQAAALLLCSEAVADELGVPAERRVHPLVGLESSATYSLSARRELHRWPAMGVLGQAAEAHLGRSLASCELAEVYSCFPAAVQVQQRELGLDPDRVPTITGGMAFAGGPLNNFVYQATVAMIERLRERPGALGLVTTVSGLLTKPGLAVWSTVPGDGPPLVGDLAAEATAATEVVESVPGYAGEAVVASYTVTPDAEGRPSRVVVIADTTDGRRCVAAFIDEDAARQALDNDLVNTTIETDGPLITRLDLGGGP